MVNCSCGKTGACTNCKCTKAGRRCNSSCRCSRFKMCTNMEAMEVVDKLVLALETETSAAQVAGVPEHDDQLEYGANAAVALPTVMVSRPPMAEADPSGTGSVSSVVASTVTRTSLGSITGR